jgi:2-keto-4-pentenoate hydratase/2-oxohepta-3-ene-1,7-dioic acid hydratase in catechol pathway
MKIIRFVSTDNKVCCGAVDSPDDDSAQLIEGDVFSNFKVSSKSAEIARLLPPVIPPDIIGIGLNYHQHADETGIKLPDIPVMFLKASGTLNGPGDPVILPKAGPEQVDIEAELGVIIGKKGKNIPHDKAMDHVLGYTCANDISARDWQIRKQKTQWARGKSFDSFCPIGPWIVTKDEIPDPHNLWIQSEINGKSLQDSNTSDMIFDIPSIVSNLSLSMTLKPGTLILTGTPNGVGFVRIPPVFLKHGDVVTIAIEKIGKLTNPVINEA